MSSSSATPTSSPTTPAASSGTNAAPMATPNVAAMAARLGSFYRPMKLSWDVSEFDGSNVTAYLRKYNLAADCGLVSRAKLDRFSAYCAISIISEVESLNGYENGDWNTFEPSLKRYYFDNDPQQREYQIPYLRSLAENQKKKVDVDIKIYATQFKKIARVLVREGKLSQYGACAEFYGGLPEKIQEHVQRRLNID